MACSPVDMYPLNYPNHASSRILQNVSIFCYTFLTALPQGWLCRICGEETVFLRVLQPSPHYSTNGLYSSFIYHHHYIILATGIIYTLHFISATLLLTSFMDRNLHLTGHFIHTLMQLKSPCHWVNSYRFKHYFLPNVRK